MVYSYSAGLLVAALTHQTAGNYKILKAILAGVITCPIIAYLRRMSRAVFGLKRESGYLEDWVEQCEEDAIEPELRIYDCHHHLWDFGTQPKIPKGAMDPISAFLIFHMEPKAISRIFAENKPMTRLLGERVPQAVPFMGAELTKDIKGNGRGHNIVGTMYMECGWHDPKVKDPCMKPASEVDMVMEQNQKYPGICQAIIASAELSLGKEVEPLLKHYAANPMVKGIRDGLACPRDELLMPFEPAEKAYGEKFREGFALLEKYGLTYHSWHFHVDMDSFTDLAKAFPNQTMICDHMGIPLGVGKYSKEAVWPEFKEKITTLAKCSNVYVKIGSMGQPCWGFGFDLRPKPPTSDELAEAWAPYVQHTLDAFGVDRCMMESNFPMDKVSCSYTTYWNALKKIVKNYSEDDKKKLFELNALRVYKITLRAKL